MRRYLALGGGAVAALVGLVVIAASLASQRDPVGWLDQNLERTDRHAWLAQDPPLATAERLDDAVPSASKVVSSWGIALRYSRGTVTVVAGPREGTASVYWDASHRGDRHYYFGRRAWWPGVAGSRGPGPGGPNDPGGPTGAGRPGDPGAPPPGGTPAPGPLGPDGRPVATDGTFAPLTPNDAVQTRRGEDFRGGGPGGGK